MANYPFYKSEEHTSSAVVLSRENNKGLIFSRFFNGYDKTWGKVSENAKTKFLNSVSDQCGDTTQLNTMASRQVALVQGLRGDAKVFASKSFVTGMGNEHPVENGFLWHYTLGVPYISGSQVKGILRSLIEEYYEGSDKSTILRKWFGSQVKHAKTATDLDSQQAGDLICFDAFPIESPTLNVEIMTPHYGEWYAKGQGLKNIQEDTTIVPADWHDPVPVPFLAVKSAKFLFSFGFRQTAESSPDDIKTVWDMFEKALVYVRAGAKTQSGFGLMVPDEKSHKDLFEQIEKNRQSQQAMKDFEESLLNQSDAYREILTLGRDNHWEEPGDESKGSFTGYISEWLNKMEQSRDEDVLRYLRKIAEIHYKDRLKKPEKIKNAQQKVWVERLLSLTNGLK
ncbi:type III-B CRISPR module RAMP protein Cmr6 [Pelistega sp. MC2]|uniref:type III-B CRISPR module RAMP protein Cmr6 n=1 Tax=Pelistega sp. MC2 TaxID=1720297 RepID=UPI0008D9B74F|nr:type III-B CRISPR module RAMP protein Cmr6 [Pelistega sp. MC2]